MRGKTHWKLGAGYYGILAFCLSVISFSWIGVIVAIVASLMADADEEHSLINSRNPVIGTANFLVRLSAGMVKLTIGFGFFWIISWLTVPLVENIHHGWGEPWKWICLFLGCVSPWIGYLLPGLEVVFNLVDAASSKLCRFVWAGFYLIAAGYGLYLAWQGDYWGLALSALCLAAVLFRHRTVLHSPEGFLLSTLCSAEVFRHLDKPELIWAFAVGYGSHLYLADIFTDTGVPVSGLPVVLDKLKIRSKLLEMEWYRKIDEVLSRKISLSLMRTNTESGNMFEGGYVMLLIVVGVLVKQYI